MGNKYFETHKHDHWRPIHRYFERPNMQSDAHVVDAAHVPPSWDAWLRFRRQDPPSVEEVKESEDYFKMQQEMAAKRKAQEQGEVKEKESKFTKLKSSR